MLPYRMLTVAGLFCLSIALLWESALAVNMLAAVLVSILGILAAALALLLILYR